jgi:fibronectin-binding autotransporter adhesin
MQAQMTWLDSDLKSYDLVNETLKNGNKGFGYAFSYEAGKVLPANELWSFTPQAQLIYSKVDFDKFTDNYRVRVTMADGDSLLARLGLAADYEKSYVAKDGKTSRVKAYGIANAYYEFLDGNEIDISDIHYSSRDARLWVGPAVGGSYNWNNDNYSAYGEIGAKTSAKHFGDNYAVSGEVGLRMRF